MSATLSVDILIIGGGATGRVAIFGALIGVKASTATPGSGTDLGR